MRNIYETNSKVFKALSDAKRLKIINLLSKGEMCGCRILEEFDFTQPTLSHHMKILVECGLVDARKEGTWSYYKLNLTNTNRLILFMLSITTDTDGCICKGK